MTEIFPVELQSKIERLGVLAVLVIDDEKHAVPLAEALLQGGIDCIELTLRTDAALEAVKLMKTHFEELTIGCGTVLNARQVDQSLEAGADFAVSPGFNPKTLLHAREVGLPFAPGVATASEIEHAVELGCSLLKFFPSETSGGLAHLKVLSAPFRHLGVKFVPLGGINLGNLENYLEERDLIAAVGGSWIAPRDLIVAEDWSSIERLATEATQSVGR
tara:strand:- start:85 stop:738 length:654 start_codon:yes stop_codon:yes gene_type:complete